MINGDGGGKTGADDVADAAGGDGVTLSSILILVNISFNLAI